MKNWRKITSFNSIPKGADRPYDIDELKKQTLELTDDLIELKTKIHEASAPVRMKIFRISEIKNIIIKLESISTKDGIVRSRSNEMNLVEMVSVLKINDIDQMVTIYQEEIDNIQAELDNFNYNTKLG